MSFAQLATEYLEALRALDPAKCWLLRLAVDAAGLRAERWIGRRVIADVGAAHLREVAHAPYFQS
jgi:hypothetical protein